MMSVTAILVEWLVSCHRWTLYRNGGRMAVPSSSSSSRFDLSTNWKKGSSLSSSSSSPQSSSSSTSPDHCCYTTISVRPRVGYASSSSVISAAAPARMLCRVVASSCSLSLRPWQNQEQGYSATGAVVVLLLVLFWFFATPYGPVNENPALLLRQYSRRQGTHGCKCVACIPRICPIKTNTIRWRDVRIIHDHQISLVKTTVFPPSFFFFFFIFSVAPWSIYVTTTTGQDMDYGLTYSRISEEPRLSSSSSSSFYYSTTTYYYTIILLPTADEIMLA